MTELLKRLAVTLKNCPEGSTDPTCTSFLPQVSANATNLKNILAIVFGIIGIVALIFIMLAGMNFILAQGNPEKIGKARQSIIFAGIGLAIALSGELIVQVVLGKL